MENEEITDEKQSNVLLYTLIGILVVIIGVVIYTYLSFDMLKKGELNNQYIKKDELTFYDLSYDIQNKYIVKSFSNDKNDILNKEIPEYKHSSQTLVEKQIDTVVKSTKEETVKVINEKVINEKITIKKFDVFKCYDMTDGGFYQSDASIEELNEFLEEHQDAKYFEIIGVVNKLDFKLLREAKSSLDNKQLNLIEEFSQLGLSRKRVVEGTWNIKQYLGSDVTLKIVNYTITSQKDHKGFVVRAYK